MAGKSLDDSLDLVLQLLHFVVEGTLGVSQDRGGHDVARHTAGLAKVSLLGHVDVDDVLLREKHDVRDCHV